MTRKPRHTNPKYSFSKRSKRSCTYFTILAKQPPNNERQTNMTIYLSKNQCFSPHESWKNRNQLWANFKTACKKSFSSFKLQIVAVCNQSIAHVRRTGSEGKHSTRDVYLANKTAVLFVVNLCHEIILYEWLADSEARDNFLRLKMWRWIILKKQRILQILALTEIVNYWPKIVDNNKWNSDYQ